MNAFYEHHKDNIRFAYRCFDRILLHAMIQPFQQEQRAVGFFWTYRQIYPVSRQVLRDIATQYHNWAKNRSQKWGVPIQEDPPGRRDDFVERYFRRAQPEQSPPEVHPTLDRTDTISRAIRSCSTNCSSGSLTGRWRISSNSEAK